MQPIGQGLPRVLVRVVRDAPLSPGKVEFAWKAAVGPAMGRVSAVCLDADGVLLVEAQTREWRNAIGQASALILSRMQALLGDDAVRSLRLRS